MGQTVWKYTPPYDDIIGGPGNRILLKGTMEAGWFGEVKASDFITGDELARKVGLNAGVSQNSNISWLKFGYRDRVHYIPKGSFRHSISWKNINSVNCVYGDKVIKHNGRKYSVMLPRGMGEDIQPDPKIAFDYEEDRAALYNSMWNKLILPVHKNAPSSWEYPENVNSPTENWETNYNFYSSKGNKIWCQEYAIERGYILTRFINSVSFVNYNLTGFNNSDFGWLPVLKLIG